MDDLDNYFWDLKDYWKSNYLKLKKSIEEIIKTNDEYDSFRDCPHYTIIEELKKLV